MNEGKNSAREKRSLARTRGGRSAETNAFASAIKSLSADVVTGRPHRGFYYEVGKWDDVENLTSDYGVE